MEPKNLLPLIVVMLLAVGMLSMCLFVPDMGPVWNGGFGFWGRTETQRPLSSEDDAPLLESPVQIESAEDKAPPEIHLRLIADENGNLADLRINDKSLGHGPQVFERLNREILKLIGTPGNPLTKEIEVEIDADHELHYEYTRQTVSAVMGRSDPQSDEIIPYVQKVKFAPPRPPKSETGPPASEKE